MWNFEDIDKVKFLRKSVDESAIGSAVFPGNAISFCHPQYTINHGISLFFRLLAEQVTNIVMTL